MPSKSKAQHNLMEACAHGAKYKNCPPKKVADEFVKADTGSKAKLPERVGKKK